MNESSVSSPFMTKLRKWLPGSVVVKHADRSMIGLVDCSVTWQKKTLWLEFKLFAPGKRWDGRLDVERLASQSPTQYEMARSLARAGHCYYVVWVKKAGRIVLWHPVSHREVEVCSSDNLVRLIAQVLTGEVNLEQ